MKMNRHTKKPVRIVSMKDHGGSGDVGWRSLRYKYMIRTVQMMDKIKAYIMVSLADS